MPPSNNPSFGAGPSTQSQANKEDKKRPFQAERGFQAPRGPSISPRFAALIARLWKACDGASANQARPKSRENTRGNLSFRSAPLVPLSPAQLFFTIFFELGAFLR